MSASAMKMVRLFYPAPCDWNGEYGLHFGRSNGAEFVREGLLPVLRKLLETSPNIGMPGKEDQLRNGPLRGIPTQKRPDLGIEYSLPFGRFAASEAERFTTLAGIPSQEHSIRQAARQVHDGDGGLRRNLILPAGVGITPWIFQLAFEAIFECRLDLPHEFGLVIDCHTVHSFRAPLGLSNIELRGSARKSLDMGSRNKVDQVCVTDIRGLKD